MGLRGRIGQIADRLLCKRKDGGRILAEADKIICARLHRSLREIDRIALHPSRRTGLQAEGTDPQIAQALRERVRGRFPLRSPGHCAMAHQDGGAHEGPAGDDQRTAHFHMPILKLHALHLAIGRDDPLHALFSHLQMFLMQQDILHVFPIGDLVALHAQALHAWPFGRVEHLELQRGRVRRPAHLSA